MKNILFFVIFLTIFGCHEQKVPVPQGNKYFTGKLAGRTFGDLYANYLGIEKGTTLKKTVETDFKENFSHMWERKMRKSKTEAVKITGEELVAAYNRTSTPTSFKEYMGQLSVIVRTVQQNLNWDIIIEKLKLSPNEANLAEKICSSLTGRHIIAYAMTELFPSAEGSLNKEFLGFLLQNAGKEYVEGIPALYDTKCSFGVYQFTEYALYHTEREVRGASIINLALPTDMRIPGSVRYLRGDHQHKAAYMFAVYNICQLVKKLDKKQFAVLKKKWYKNTDDILLYCATAHHAPALAQRAAKKWLKDGANDPFENFCQGRIKPYAKKTRSNLAVL